MSIKLTERDQRIISYLKSVKVANTTTLLILFFSNCNYYTGVQRLSKLVKEKHIKVFSENVMSENIYYIGQKPRNYKHKLLFSSTMAYLKENQCEILNYKTPLQVGNLIADGYVEVKYNNKMYNLFIENEISKKLNIAKYEDLYFSRSYKQYWDIFPIILCTTSKPAVRSKYLKVIFIKNDKLASKKLYKKIRQNNDSKTTL